ncbi:MAG: Na+/H+ antiporter subunit E [Candidatus Zixiibacteriota bacterium]
MLLFLFAVWILLTYPINNHEIIAGAIISVFIVLISLGSPCLVSEINLSPKSFIYLIGYIFFFIFALVKSNLDVAFRVLNPELPINPGIVKVQTKLKSKLGRLVLANSITLTPGTLTVETVDEHFYIHWIDVQGKNIQESTEKIVYNFERFLEVIFG